MEQLSLYDEDHAAKSLLAQLLHDSQLYQTTAEYQELMQFILKFRNFAPFILKAAGKVETILGLGDITRFGPK